MNILSATNLQFSKKLTDPAYPSIEYSYSLLNNKKEYQIASIMQDPNTIVYNPIITPVSAAATNFTANVQGNYNGLVATVSTGKLPTTSLSQVLSLRMFLLSHIQNLPIKLHNLRILF